MINLIREIYDKGLKGNEVFVSNGYNMEVLTDFQKEIKKTYYQTDKKKKFERVRELVKNHKVKVYINKGINFQNDIIAYCNEQGLNYSELVQNENRFFYGCSVSVSYVRELEIENYVEQIFLEAEQKLKDNNGEPYIAICYLIDKQFTKHINVLESQKHDLIYRSEYNQLIYELIQDKINKISKIEHVPISENIRNKINKGLNWKAPKMPIGTLFGILRKEGVIEGSVADIAKSLSAMFTNLSESTLKDNINLKEDKKEAKFKYDLKTVDYIDKWVKYLKE